MSLRKPLRKTNAHVYAHANTHNQYARIYVCRPQVLCFYRIAKRCRIVYNIQRLALTFHSAVLSLTRQAAYHVETFIQDNSYPVLDT